MPLFSIMIPAKGQPLYTRDAVLSAIHQDFDDFDVTLSNNGADPAVKAGIAEFMGDPRFHYIEQPSILDMPTHWDVASGAVAGDYLLVLSNRSVLKQGVLQKLSKLIKSKTGSYEAVSWRWDEYTNDDGVVIPCPPSSGAMRRLKTSDELLKFARTTDQMYHIYTLPRGYNSCVSRSLVARIREREGHAFQAINPDYRFAFSSLLNTNELVHFDEAFFITQGPEVSNGINAMRGDVQPFINSLGLAEPWQDVPIKAALVYNGIAQDFLATLRQYGRSDIAAQWNRSKYYVDCLTEIRIKRNAGILATSVIAELTKSVEMALQNEHERIRASVVTPITKTVLRKIKSLAKIVAGSAVDLVRTQAHPCDVKKTFRTALEAAGFQH